MLDICFPIDLYNVCLPICSYIKVLQVGRLRILPKFECPTSSLLQSSDKKKKEKQPFAIREAYESMMSPRLAF